MNANELQIGDAVSESPVGPGVITSITERGFPRVNEVAVVWVRREDGCTFDPYAKVGGSRVGTSVRQGEVQCH